MKMDISCDISCDISQAETLRIDGESRQMSKKRKASPASPAPELIFILSMFDSRG